MGTGETAVPMHIFTFLPYDLLLFFKFPSKKICTAVLIYLHKQTWKKKTPLGLLLLLYVADNNKYIYIVSFNV